MQLELYSIALLSGLLVGMASFVSTRKHLLNALLSLEFTMLNLFLLTIMMFSMGHSPSVGMFFLILAACEGALGLGILIRLARSRGNDLVDTLLMF